MAMSKGLKIGLGVGLLLLLLVALWYIFKGGSSTGGNKYAGATALAAGKATKYGAYADDSAGYTAASALQSDITGDYSTGIPNWDAYGRAWFKGMNIKATPETVGLFKSDVVKYAGDAALRQPHWSVTKGSFLTA